LSSKSFNNTYVKKELNGFIENKKIEFNEKVYSKID
jgi:hypothetical protein